MTNNEIIYEAVSTTFSPAQLCQLVNAVYTPEQISRQCAALGLSASAGSISDLDSETVATLAAATFHTFAEWKRLGYSVIKGQKSALTLDLWKYTDKPGKAAREAATQAGDDCPECDPHFYLAKAHLFHRLQVKRAE